MEISHLLQYLIGGLTSGSIYALAAVGFTLIYNVSKVVNFAQGEFVMLGGLATFFFLQWFPFPPVLSGVLAVLSVGLLAVLFYVIFIENYRNADHLLVTLLTLGGSMMFVGLAAVVFDRNPHTLPPFSSSSEIQFFGASIPVQAIWVLTIAILLIVLLNLFLNRTHLGRLMRACSENEELVRLSGVNPKVIYRLSFALSGVIGSIGGIIIAPISFISYTLGEAIGIKGLIAAIFGGLSSFYGGLLGGLTIGVIESLGAGLIASDMKDIIAFALLIVILLARPTGLLGRRRNR